MPEAVNHPDHYGGDKPYETIKVLEAWLTTEQLIGFCRGNAIKYLSRADKKGDAITDLKKAVWYINEEIYVRAMWHKETDAVESKCEHCQGTNTQRSETGGDWWCNDCQIWNRYDSVSKACR